jgi:hypothetical protein
VTASSTIGSIASFNPFTPITPLDNDDVDDEQADTPDDAGHLATPHHPHPPLLSIAMNRTLVIVDRVGDIDEPKVPHQLAAAGQIEFGGNRPTRSSVAAHESDRVGENDHTEAVQRSPDSDPFEYDDNTSTQSSVEHHESVNSSNQVEDSNDTNVAQHLPTSDESYSDGISPTNPNTDNQEETVYPNAVQQSTMSDQPESPGSNSSTATMIDPHENDDANVLQPSSTSERSESDGSITADSTTVDTTPNPALTTPSSTEFSLNRFDKIVQALADLSPPATFDGDIVVPVDQDLKLHICEKGYDASFKHEEDDEDGEPRQIDESKE